MKYTFNSVRMLPPVQFTLALTLGIAMFSFNSGVAQIGQSTEADANKIVYQNIDVATFDLMRKDADNVKVDVRNADEMKQGRLGGSLEIDYQSASFVSQLNTLDRNANYLVFSKDGTNSAKAAQRMVDLGFMHVYNLEGGYVSWEAADRPPE